MKKIDPSCSQALPASEFRAALSQLVPTAIGEDGIRLDVLIDLIGEEAASDAPDRYELTWAGKSKARRIAQQGTRATLRPDRGRSVNWEATRNLVIEGDCLEVMKCLRKSLHGTVDVIYIDPPYNTGADQIYPDDFSDSLDTYLEYSGQSGQDGLCLRTNVETGGRYHTTWLNMIFPRLMLARSLLAPTGAIFVSIDDHEAHNLRLVLDEVFGPENFICTFAWQKRYSPPPDSRDVGYLHESIMMYRRSELFTAKLLPPTDEQLARYKNPDNDPRGPWKAADYTCRYTATERPTLFYPITNPNTGEEVWPKESRVWNSSIEQTAQNQRERRLWWGADGTNSVPALKNFLSDVKPGRMPDTLLTYDKVGHTDEAAKELRKLVPGVKFTSKPTRLIEHLLQISADKNALVLDFFAGSGTLGDAVMRLNAEDGGSRRFILVQLPEPLDHPRFDTVFELALARLTAAAGAHTEKTDCGYRVFRLDSTNIKPWDASLGGPESDLLAMVDNIKQDRSEEDVLHELLLKYGLDLSIPVEERSVEGKRIFVLGAGALVVCLASGVSLKVIEGIGALRAELQPEVMRVVFRDASFEDDIVKTNAMQILKRAGIDDVKSL